MAKITVFTMGHTGVVLDPNTLEMDVPLDALERAKNAVQDPKEGHGGAIRKRPGLARFNIAYAGGVILGGIPMPVAGFGGAPASGGGALIGTGDDGTSVGTGDMTGSPGGTFGSDSPTGGDAPPEFPPAGAGLFGGGALFGGVRLFVFGRVANADVDYGGTGWYVAPKGLGQTAVSATTPGPPIRVYSFPPVAPFGSAGGKPYCIDPFSNKGLYYAAQKATPTPGTQPGGLTQMVIRQTDGGTDTLVATIPFNTNVAAGVASPAYGLLSYNVINAGSGYTNGNTLVLNGGTGSAASLAVTGNGGITAANTRISSAGAYTVIPTGVITFTGGTGSGASITATFGGTPQRGAVTDMHYGSDGNVYVCMKDKFTGQNTAGSVGRVFRLAPSSGAVSEMNMFQNGESSTSGAFEHLPYCSCFFDNKLYVGTFPDAINESAHLRGTDGVFVTEDVGFASPTTSVNYAFHPCMALYNGRLFVGMGDWETTPSFAGVWSRKPGPLIDINNISAWSQSHIASGGSAVAGNYFVSFFEFNGALYASWHGSTVLTKIYKIVADNIGDETSSSFTTTTVYTNTGDVTLQLFADDGIIYAVDMASRFALASSDGSSWTDQSANLPSFSSSTPTPIFFGLNQ